MKQADTSCIRREALWTVGGLRPLSSQSRAIMSMNARLKPKTGDTTRGMRILSTSLPQRKASMPPWATTAPHRPPINAWELDEGQLQVSPIAEVQMIRIIQEALTNIRRHAGAQSAAVTLRAAGATLEVTVRDDGRGFDPAHVSRGYWPQFGLQAMRERAESIGGSLTVESCPGEGAVVVARFPGALAQRGAVQA